MNFDTTLRLRLYCKMDDKINTDIYVINIHTYTTAFAVLMYITKHVYVGYMRHH